jgi:hypothetical protein
VTKKTFDQVKRETRIVASVRASKTWARGLAVKPGARPRYNPNQRRGTQ